MSYFLKHMIGSETRDKENGNDILTPTLLTCFVHAVRKAMPGDSHSSGVVHEGLDSLWKGRVGSAIRIRHIWSRRCYQI
jgi:hypothetical protein